MFFRCFPYILTKHGELRSFWQDVPKRKCSSKRIQQTLTTILYPGRATSMGSWNPKLQYLTKDLTTVEYLQNSSQQAVRDKLCKESESSPHQWCIQMTLRTFCFLPVILHCNRNNTINTEGLERQPKLRALTALQEETRWIPSTHTREFTNACNSSTEVSHTGFCKKLYLPGPLVFTHIHTRIYSLSIKIMSFNKSQAISNRTEV